MQKNDLLSHFKKEVQNSLLLGDEDKQYWLSNADKLPVNLIEYFYQFLSEKNRLVEKYIDKAIEQDPSLVTQLKNKIKKTKKHILEFKEKEQEKPEEAEKRLEEELKKI